MHLISNFNNYVDNLAKHLTDFGGDVEKQDLFYELEGVGSGREHSSGGPSHWSE